MCDPTPPGIIYWLLPTDVVLVSLPGRPPDAPEIVNPARRKAYLRPWVPFAAVAWRLLPTADWRPLEELPPEWNLRPLDGNRVADESDESDESDDAHEVRARADAIARRRRRLFADWLEEQP